MWMVELAAVSFDSTVGIGAYDLTVDNSAIAHRRNKRKYR